MIIRVFENRSVTKDAEPYGTQNENRVTTLNFEFPEGYENFNKKIVFITSDGNYWDIINDNTYIIKNNITKYKNISAFVWLTNVETQVDFRTKIFDIDFNKNINPDDYTPSEEQISGFDTMMQELNEAIEEVKQLPSMKYEIVEELPTEDIDTHTIYLILREEPEGNNYYDEYLYINNSWEKIGSTDVDLSDLIDDIENLENRVFSERNVKSESNTLILENTEEDMGLEVSEIDGWTEQNSTTGINLFNISAFTTATTIQGVTFTPVANGGIEMSGTSTNTGQLDIAFSYEASGNYTMATIVDGTFSASPQVLCQSSSGNVMYNNAMSSNTTKINTFSNVSATIVRARIYFISGVTFNCTLYTMLLSGTYTSSNLPTFEPYTNGASPNPTYPQDIEVVTGTQEAVVSNKNLCNVNFNSITIAGVTLTKNSDNTITANGTATSTIAVNILNNNGGTSTDNLTLPKGTYTLSGCPSGGGISTNYKLDLVRNNGPLITDTGTSTTYTATSDTAYSGIRIVIYSGTTCNNLTFKPMLELGSTATSYIEHAEQTQQLRLGDIELAKIGAYQDRIYKNNDKWYIEKNIGKYILESAKNWQYISVTQGSLFRSNNSISNAIIDNSYAPYCNYYKGIPLSQTRANNNIIINNSSTYTYIDIVDNRYTSVDTFKTWLASNNVELYYVLSTPTTTEITDSALISDLNVLQHLKQYDDTTIITIDDIKEYQVTLESDRIVVIENEQVEQNSRIAELEEENSYLSSIIDQIIPKETVEGSSITLDNTLQGKLKLNERKGDTEQETYEGYNLLPPGESGTYTSNGATHTSNGKGIYTINGTATGTSFHNFQVTPYTIKSGDYLHLGNSTANSNVAIALLVSGSEQIMFRSCGVANAIQDLSSYEGKVVNYVRLFTNAQTLSNFELKPMIVQSSTAKPFEQYVGGQASPNPTYPQDINVVTGTQDILINGTNIYDSSYRTPDNSILCAGGTCTEANGVFTIQATRNDMYVWNVQTNGSTYSAYQNQLIDFIENTYTITITNSLFTKNFITFYDKDKKVLNFKQFNTNIFTFTKGQDDSVPSTAKYFTLRFGIQESVSGTTYTTSVQIEVGSTATPYTPYQEQTKTLHLSSKNLFQTGFRQGGFGGTEANRIFSTSNAKIKSGVTYTLSTNLDTTKFRYACNIGTAPFPTTIENRVYDSGWKYSSSFTFTALTSGYFGLPVSKNDDSNLTPSDIEGVWWQLEEGSTATTYEPYYNYELAKIGTYQDRIFESSGKNKYDSNNVIENALIQPSNNKIGATSECTTIWFKCTPNTTYTLSRDKGDRLVIGGTNTQPVINGEITTLYDVGVSEVKTYTFNSGNFEYIAIYISRYNTSKPTIVMINEGSSALPYEPYGSDKWYIEKNVGKVVLNGSESGWNTSSLSVTGFKSYYIGLVTDRQGQNDWAMLCSHFTQKPYSSWTGLVAENFCETAGNNVGFRIDETLASNLANFKTWLSSNNLVFYYVLATPTYEEITNTSLIEELNELEKMYSYSGQTNIIVNGNLPMIINVTALKNLS